MKKPMAWLAVVAAFWSLSSAAHGYPDRPIQFIVPAAPTTATDATARFLAEQMTKEWNTSVAVENKVGANGIIGANFVKHAANDGYTLMMAPSTLYINKSLYKTLPYEPVKDFQALIGVNNAYLVLVAPASAPFDSVRGLVDYAKSNPGKLSYSSAGVGSTTHLAAALFVKMAGLDVVHVPYSGGAKAVTDTISGEVQFTVTAIATALPQIASGRLKALAVTGLERAKSLPDVPTLDESGLKGFEVASKTFVVAPAGIPPDVARKIIATVGGIIKTPEYQKFLEQRGLDVEKLSPAEYAASGSSEVSRWAKIVELSGAKPN